MSAFYTGVLALTVISMIAMVVNVRHVKVLTANRRSAFTGVFLLIALVAVGEWLGVYCQEAPFSARELHAFAKMLEFSCAAFLPLLFAYCFEGRRTRFGRVLFWVCIAHALLELASAVVTQPGLVFYVSASDGYHRSSLYWVYLLCVAAPFVYFFTRAVLFSRSYQNRDFTSLALCAVVVLAGAVVQFVDSSVRITWLTVGIAAILLYIYYKDLVLQVDPITKILNRLTFDNFMGCVRKPVLLVVLDVNKFKAVNDTYGHSYGDECLLSVAQAMRHVYGKVGRCFRTGGDEFAVVIERDLERAPQLEQAFHEEMDRRRALDARLPGVAVGSAMYDPAGGSIEGAIILADEMMYEQKRSLRGE